MKILLLGATGIIGSRILKEAVDRGHVVTAVARSVDKLTAGDHVRVVQADVKNTPLLIGLANGQDAIVSSLSPRGDAGREQYLEGVRSVLTAAKAIDAPYVLFVGGMVNLMTSNGKRILNQLLETIPVDKFMEPIVVAEARVMITASDANWTFFCPDGTIEPGKRTGKFRLGGNKALVDLDTPSAISTEDYAVAVIDELEHPRHLRQIFNICY